MVWKQLSSDWELPTCGRPAAAMSLSSCLAPLKSSWPPADLRPATVYIQAAASRPDRPGEEKKKCPFFLRLHGDVRGSGTNTGGGDDRHLRLLCECTNTSIQSASLCVTNYTKVFCNLKMSLGVWLSLLVSPLESRVLTKGGNALTQSKHAFFLDELTC